MPDPNTGGNQPQVTDKRVIPPGILPKNMQAWVVCAIALVMVIVIALSGRNPKERSTPPLPQSPVIDPSQARIEEYRKRIEAQTRKLELEQAALAHNQEMLPSSNVPNNDALAGSYRGLPPINSS